jgi:probable F420-dependent oxidoreductase
MLNTDVEPQGNRLLRKHFSCYILPGRVTNPAVGIQQAIEAEKLGLGAVWISERYAVKEPAVLSGAVSQATSRLDIAGTFYATMRNPLVTASVASTMQAISHDRFRLLLAKGVPAHLREMGSPPITFNRLADFIFLLRQLWAGETVSYKGILGEFPELKLTDRYDGPPPPVIMTAIGPKSLAFAGEHCDGVLLHPFITTNGLKKSIEIVKVAAEKAGRSADSVKFYQAVVVAPDLARDEEDAVVGGRAVTYFQIPQLGEMICEMNGWDESILSKVRTHPLLANLGGSLAEQKFTREQLVEVSQVIPRGWFDEGAAIGSVNHCASRLCDFLDAGVDEVLLHGSTPDQLHDLAGELVMVLPKRM